MTPHDFSRRVAALRLSSEGGIAGARAVLIEGQGIRQAALAAGVDFGQLSKIVKRIREVEVCPTCGNPR